MAAMAAMSATMAKCVPSANDFKVVTPLRKASCSKPARGLNGRRNSVQVRAFFDVGNDPIVKEALKEPVAFLGGVFAGLLRLDLNEEPLREWVAKTAEAAGIEMEDPKDTRSDDGPKEIEIE